MTTTNPRLTGPPRKAEGARLKAIYDEGTSIRAIASKEGKPYGTVHRILSEAGTQFRQRGGPRGVGVTTGDSTRTLILRAMGDAGRPVTAGEVAPIVHVTGPAVHHQLRRLVKDRLVERRGEGGFGGAFLWSLTARGLQAAEAAASTGDARS
jgi:DNA-binding transcriptional ArsR family regulator